MVKKDKPSAAAITLQWLVYAFWMLFSFAMVVLVQQTSSFFFNKDISSYGSETVYPLVGAVTFFVIAATSDFIYTKKKVPEKASTFAAVVYVVHAVLFAVAAAIALTSVLFVLVNMAVDITQTPADTAVNIITALAMLVTYGLLLTRITLSHKRAFLPYVTTGVIAVILAVAAIAAAVGPLHEAARLQHDQIVQDAAVQASSGVYQYYSEHQKLPAGIADISQTDYYLGDNYRYAVDNNLLNYKVTSQNSYQLCVVYEHELDPRHDNSQKQTFKDEIFQIQSHDSGESCYNVKVSR